MLNDRNMENKHNQMFYPERASEQASVCLLKFPTETTDTHVVRPTDSSARTVNTI